MTPIPHPEPAALRATLDQIILRHGRWRVWLALLGHPRARPKAPKPLPPLGLNDHLRRDIGLDPLPPRRDWG